jgi:Domain of unknown function (DUF4291)
MKKLITNLVPSKEYENDIDIGVFTLSSTILLSCIFYIVETGKCRREESMLIFERYIDQAGFWPKSGRYILAQTDTESVIVYQAFRQSIGQFAYNHGYFGGEFNYSRMSWIKTNFLWMMYRSGWGTKVGQEVILAIRISRSFFDELLLQAVESSFPNKQFSTQAEWKRAIITSSVRIQWDPDHHPRGTALKRRAIQIGLRGKTLNDYGKDKILEIIDLTTFVNEQRINTTTESISELMTPAERVYIPDNPDIKARIGLDENL